MRRIRASKKLLPPLLPKTLRKNPSVKKKKRNSNKQVNSNSKLAREFQPSRSPKVN
jgi:hypothetical protein